MAGTLALALAVAGCGGSSHHSAGAADDPASVSGTGTATTSTSTSSGASQSGASQSGASQSGASQQGKSQPGESQSSRPAPGSSSSSLPSASPAAARAAGRLPAGVVATVAGQPITLAQYRQVYAGELSASSQIPLDPPSYARCTSAIAKLYERLPSPSVRGAHTRAAHIPVPSQSQLRGDCRERLQGLRQSTMSQLIQQVWVEREAAADGISTSSSAVNAAVGGQRRAMGGSAAYARYLARIGETPQQAADQARFGLLEQALQQRRLGAPANVSSAQVAAFFAAHHSEFVLPRQPVPKLSTYATRIRLLLSEQVGAQRAATATTAFERHWRAVTVCRPGYLVPLCANGT